MTRYDALMDRISRGARILIDGATGTELEDRGVAASDEAWTGGAALTHPDILRGIHEDYLRLGAEIVISNTFGATRHALEDAGLGAQFDDLNRLGVEIARDAREKAGTPQALVAGGISYWSWTERHPPLEQLRSDVARQARVMAEASADLLMLEMMVDIDRMLVTLEAARSSGLPVWVGLTCEPDQTGRICLRNGEPLSDALIALSGLDVPLISIMHSHVNHIDASLDVTERHWHGATGVYAHAGGHSGEAWIEDNMCPPAAYAAACQRWLGRGVQVIGGCCGFGVAHMKAVRDIM
ncbi:MAG: homocysteine S-methyltransferase family protein [Paracoccaceae bacterium]|nr:homocysteine S-methyltransferase family protein [Paracoccaceae bacterium]